ncbi:MAG: hypothetical protein JWQ12_391 [Glaciihabitans sp.]|nr:hypothetical protein [Glaciihabitans sp.]
MSPTTAPPRGRRRGACAGRRVARRRRHWRRMREHQDAQDARTPSAAPRCELAVPTRSAARRWMSLTTAPPRDPRRGARARPLRRRAMDVANDGTTARQAARRPARAACREAAPPLATDARSRTRDHRRAINTTPPAPRATSVPRTPPVRQNQQPNPEHDRDARDEQRPHNVDAGCRQLHPQHRGAWRAEADQV